MTGVNAAAAAGAGVGWWRSSSLPSLFESRGKVLSCCLPNLHGWYLFLRSWSQMFGKNEALLDEFSDGIFEDFYFSLLFEDHLEEYVKIKSELCSCLA